MTGDWVFACPDCGQVGTHADTCTCFPGEPVEHGNRVYCNCHVTGPDEFGNRDLIPSGSCPLHG